MKSVIEASAYLIIMALICYVGIDFVVMNRQISKVDEVAQYLADYVEVNSACIKTGEDGKYILDDVTVNVLNHMAADNGMAVTYEYETFTEKYVYWNLQLQYDLKANMFNLGKQHNYKVMARTQLREG